MWLNLIRFKQQYLFASQALLMVFSATTRDKTDDGKEPPDAGGGKQQRMSFRDMVMGRKEAPPSRKKVDLIKESLAHIEYEEGNPLKPKVVIKESVFDGLCAPWKDALVVKLLGKSLGYNTMRDRLSRIWKLGAGFEILDIGNYYFMVKFDDAADREKVMDGGPWMVFDHYLTVQTWSPEFASPTAKINKTMVWIRFPGLNLFYYDESIPMAMAAAVGKPVKVDSNTLDVKRGRFVRVCVEVDLTKPVVGKVWMRGFWYKVEYVGLHRICSSCGCYGHLGRDCTSKYLNVITNLQGAASGGGPGGEPGKSTPSAAVQQTQTKEDSAAITVPTVTPQNPAQSNDNHSDTAMSHEPLLGDWMIVKRKQRNTRVANNGKDPAKNKREKPHAAKGNSRAHAKMANNKTKGGPPNATKDSPPHLPNANNKRPRKENDVGPSNQKNNPTFSIGKVAPEARTEKPKQRGPIDKVYDIGFGAKSTVDLKAVSASHFVFIGDEKDNEDKQVDPGEQIMEDANQLDIQVDFVPQTQDNEANMDC